MNILHDQKRQPGKHGATCVVVDNGYAPLYADCPPEMQAESLAVSQILVLGESLGSLLLH